MGRAVILARVVLPVLLVWLAAGPAMAQSWAQFLVHPAMRALGLKDGSATLESIGTNRIVLSDVSLSPDLTADRVEVTFDPLAVLGGRVETVRVEGAVVRAAVDDQGRLAIAGLPEPAPASGADEPASAFVFPLNTLSLSDSRLILDLPGGAVQAEATLDARFDAGVRATGDLTVRHAAGEARLALDELQAGQVANGDWQGALAGRLTATGQGAEAGGPLTLTATVGNATTGALAWTAGEADLPEGMTMTGLRLSAELAAEPSGVPMLTAKLEADEATGAGWTVGKPQIRLSGATDDLRLAITTSDQTDPLTARLRLGEQRRLSLRGNAVVDWLLPIVQAAGLPLSGSGEIAADVSLTLPEGSFTDPDTLDKATADGMVSLKLAELRWGELAAAETMDGYFLFQAAQNSGHVRFPEGMRIAGLSLAETIRERLPPTLAPLLAEPVFVAYGGPTLGRPEIALERTSDGGIAAESTLALRLGNPAFGLLIEGKVAAALPAGGQPSLTSPALTLHLVETQLGKMQASGEFVLADLEATPERVNADLTLAARTGGSPDPAFRFAQADLDAEIGLDWQPSRLTLDLQPGSRARLLGLAGRTVRLTSPVTLQLAEGDAQRITVDLEQGGLTGDLTFARVSGALTLREAGQQAQSVAMRLDGLGVELRPEEHRIRVRDGQLRVPELSLLADRLQTDLRFGQQGQGHTGRIAIGRIRHAVDQPQVVPLRLRLDLDSQGDRLTFKGELADQQQRFAFTVTGAHDLAVGTGQARLKAPLLFLPDVLQPADLFPKLGNLVLDANADIALDAEVRWSPKGIRQTGRLTASVDHLETAELSVRGASTEVTLASLVPPATAGPQRVTIARLDVGVPLTLGIATFDLRSLDDIRVHLEQFDLFGGQVRAEPIHLNPDTLSFDTVLNIDGIDLGQALRFAEFGELTAEGKLVGRIPIITEGGEMLIRGARLETQRPGRIRYKAIAVGDVLQEANQATDLVVQALQDFRYDRFVIELDEQNAEELMIKIHFAGRSAKPLTRGGVTLDPVPIEININLEGPMRQILNDAVDDTSDITGYSWTEEEGS